MCWLFNGFRVHAGVYLGSQPFPFPHSLAFSGAQPSTSDSTRLLPWNPPFESLLPTNLKVEMGTSSNRSGQNLVHLPKLAE